MTSLTALILAAGEGKRLRPLTEIRPKPLCPVNNVPLIDCALRHVAAVCPIDPTTVAVNAHHLGRQVVEHMAGRVTLSVEEPVALGTAGAVGALREWIDGRDVLIANSDAWFAPGFDLSAFVGGWDRERPRLLVVADPKHPDFTDGSGEWRFVGVSLLPSAFAARLEPEPSGLYEVVWSRTDLDLQPTNAVVVDCGTPADYLRANLLSSGGRSVIGPGARVEGEVVRSVVWPGGVVRRGERLVESVRVGADLTVAAALSEAGLHRPRGEHSS